MRLINTFKKLTGVHIDAEVVFDKFSKDCEAHQHYTKLLMQTTDDILKAKEQYFRGLRKSSTC